MLPLAVGDALPLGVGVALPLGLALAAGTELLSTTRLITLRNRSSAAVPMVLRSSFWPGTETTMFRLPSVTTSASATPRALTRFSMISRARSSWSAPGARPAWVCARRVTRVPPTRSRPSFGCRRSRKLPLVPAKNTRR